MADRMQHCAFKLDPVDHELILDAGWRRPKCPFCYSEIGRPESRQGDKKSVEHGLAVEYRVEKCSICGASYSLDPICEDKDMFEEIASLLGKEEYEILGEDLSDEVDTFIFHNYSYAAHAFNEYLIPRADAFLKDLNLGHLWFCILKKPE